MLRVLTTFYCNQSNDITRSLGLLLVLLLLVLLLEFVVRQKQHGKVACVESTTDDAELPKNGLEDVQEVGREYAGSCGGRFVRTRHERTAARTNPPMLTAIKMVSRFGMKVRMGYMKKPV
jgi:hypothetical protein